MTSFKTAFKRTLCTATAALALCTFGAEQAHAAAFGLRENSAIFNGYAASGQATSGDDLAVMTNNAAALVLFDGFRTTANGNYVVPQGKQNYLSAVTNIPGITTIPGIGPLKIEGGNSRDFTLEKVIPATYLAYAPTEDLHFGLGITVPFGLITSYGADSLSRYQALFSQIQATDFNPNVAYRINKYVSIGGGFSVQKVKAKLTNAIDFGTLVPLAQFGAGLINQQQLVRSLVTGASKLANDGRADLQGTSYAESYNVGVLLQPLEGTTIGLSYRSGLNQKIKGRADFAIPNQYKQFIGLTGLFSRTGAVADLSLPGNYQIGLSQVVTKDLTVHFDFTETLWHRFKSLRADFDNPLQPPNIVPQNYQDAAFIAIGGSYNLTPQLTLTSGFAYDQSPITGMARTFRLPDTDRYILSGGLNFKLNDKMTINGSYQHFFTNPVSVNQSSPNTTFFDTVRSTSTVTVDIFSASLQMTF